MFREFRRPEINVHGNISGRGCGDSGIDFHQCHQAPGELVVDYAQRF
jgi:hypothetical protein